MPYIILYRNTGICDKSILLAAILKELGFDIALFYWKDISHLAVGIKVPEQYGNFNSSYAYIESTNPLIPTISKVNLTLSKKRVNLESLGNRGIIFISNGGFSMSSIAEEFNDGYSYQSLGEKAEQNGYVLNSNDYVIFSDLKNKYGLDNNYQITNGNPCIMKPFRNNTEGRFLNGKCISYSQYQLTKNLMQPTIQPAQSISIRDLINRVNPQFINPEHTPIGPPFPYTTRPISPSSVPVVTGVPSIAPTYVPIMTVAPVIKTPAPIPYNPPKYYPINTPAPVPAK
jgi:hypothetical protein